GGTAHAASLVSANNDDKVQAVLTMDMIGYTGDADLDCLLETNASGQFLIDAYSAAAAQYTTLRIVSSLNPFGSDHVPYLNRGMAALLTIENDWDSYPDYHRTTDTANNITIDMGLQTLRMNVAALAKMIASGPAGTGSDTIGVYDPATSNFFLRNSNSAGAADLTFGFGAGGAGYLPLSGDWNGDGSDSIGLYDPVSGVFFLKNTNSPGGADLAFNFGPTGLGWKPLVGDWDGNGTDTIGLYNPATGTFFLRNSNAPGAADLAFGYGPAGAMPVTGDWDGNGTDTIGIYIPATSTYFLRNSSTPGAADLVFSFGAGGAGYVPVVGDWNGDGADTAGLYQPSGGSFFLRNANSPGSAALVFGYGPPAGMISLRGDWDNL
ncbi:MAG: M28 family peptidase, partial [Acidobacteria bacterium]|nr:M28 family peptidase [Acidobacteriota bacterium]